MSSGSLLLRLALLPLALSIVVFCCCIGRKAIPLVSLASIGLLLLSIVFLVLSISILAI